MQKYIFLQGKGNACYVNMIGQVVRLEQGTVPHLCSKLLRKVNALYIKNSCDHFKVVFLRSTRWLTGAFENWVVVDPGLKTWGVMHGS